MPPDTLSSGVLGNADLSIPVNRVNLDSSVVNSRRPFAAFGPIITNDFEGRSRYHSLQVTLSRQTSQRVQCFAAYTLSKAQGTLGGEGLERDPFDASRTYGVLDEDRTHILNVSWNALLPDGSRGLDNAFGRALLDGWQLSGISTFTSGIRFDCGSVVTPQVAAYLKPFMGPRTSWARAGRPTGSRQTSCATRGSEDRLSARRSSISIASRCLPSARIRRATRLTICGRPSG